MNTCYIISYDMAEGGNYDDLYEAIKAYGTSAPIYRINMGRGDQE